MCVGPVFRCVDNLKIFKVTLCMCSVVCCVCGDFVNFQCCFVCGLCVVVCGDFEFFKKSPGTVTDLVVLYCAGTNSC